MKKSFYGLKLILAGIVITSMLQLTGCTSSSEIQFPVEVGVKPESI
ncbi:hypothetical protein [Flexithrix dorotheae]|nr:hypothetical protein [Flexithrix dorotheae]